MKKTIYQPNQIILGSKDQLCIKKDFSRFSGNGLNEMCNKAIKEKDKSSSC